MRRASVTIGTLLVLGATTALVNCGGDDSTGTTGTGGSGGSGATGGSAGGTGGSGGSTGGAGGAGMQDSGADQSSGGSAGAGGSAGKAGGSGAGGAAGKGGAAGTGGSAGAAGGKAGASGRRGVGGRRRGQWKGRQRRHEHGRERRRRSMPRHAAHAGLAMRRRSRLPLRDVTCSCLDPGPEGIWMCHGGTHDGGGSDAGRCPADDPTGTFCPDAGLPIGPCLYPGNTTCTCSVGDVEWSCIRFKPAN